MEHRTITLTGRPPVRINEADWPLIARASDKTYDNQYEFQANQISRWFCGVRQHADGRTIVYATYSYDTNWSGARCYRVAHGELLPADTPNDQICRAIERVCGNMAAAPHDGKDAERWVELEPACIGDLPAEALV